MSFLSIVWKSMRQRMLATTLTILSIGLGVGLVVLILMLREEVEQSFSQRSVGYEMLVGAKGSPLQLVLNTIYGLGAPVGNIPYEYYERIADDRMVRLAVPVTVGDNYRGFRVIGTTPAFFNEFTYLEDRKFEMAEGRVFKGDYEAVVGARAAREAGLKIGDTFTPAHGVSAEEGGEVHEEAKTKVVGIMRETGTPMDRGIYVPLETVWGIHAHEVAESDPRYEGMTKEQIEQMKQLEAMEAAHEEQSAPADSSAEDHDHHDAHDNAAHGDTAHDEHGHDGDHDEIHAATSIPDSLKSVTAIYVTLKNRIVFDRFRRAVLDEPVAQAVIPAMEIMNLFEIVGNINAVLLAIAYVVVLVALAGVLVSIYNTMNERRREIAIMRALGARRRTIFALLVAESAIIAFIGGVVGLLLGHGGMAAAADMMQQQTGLPVAPFILHPFEPLVLVAVVLLGAIAGMLPALKGYRTDVQENLAPVS